MKTCPKCWDQNLPTATACKRCGLPFDQTAVTLGRNCPAGRHVMDPNWTVCAFCKAEGLVTDDMNEPAEPIYAGGTPPPPPPPQKTMYERNGQEQYGPGGTRSEDGTRKEEPDVVPPIFSAGVPSAIPAGVPSAVPVTAGRHARTQFERPPDDVPGTVQEAAASPAGQGVSQGSNGPIERKTIVDDSPPIKLQGVTPMADAFKGSFGSGSPAGGSSGAVKSPTGYGGPGAMPVAAGDQRKIVGILITYTWRPEGQIFPVREGRNWIGRDPNQADIVIEQDETLSSVNSTISFRSRFVIGDKDSMCGTWLDGKAVEDLSHPLPNYAKIRTGSTTWTFIAIEPPVVEAPPVPPAATAPPAS